MDDSKENGPSEVPDEVREQLEEPVIMGPVAFWFRIALIILLLIEWFVFDFEHLKLVLGVLFLLLQRFVET